MSAALSRASAAVRGLHSSASNAAGLHNERLVGLATQATVAVALAASSTYLLNHPQSIEHPPRSGLTYPPSPAFPAAEPSTSPLYHDARTGGAYAKGSRTLALGKAWSH